MSSVCYNVCIEQTKCAEHLFYKNHILNTCLHGLAVSPSLCARCYLEFVDFNTMYRMRFCKHNMDLMLLYRCKSDFILQWKCDAFVCIHSWHSAAGSALCVLSYPTWTNEQSCLRIEVSSFIQPCAYLCLSLIHI